MREIAHFKLLQLLYMTHVGGRTYILYGHTCRCEWECVYVHMAWLLLLYPLQMSYQPYPGVPPGQCSPGGGGWQWETESHTAGSLCQWARGLPDPATQGVWSRRPQGKRSDSRWSKTTVYICTVWV